MKFLLLTSVLPLLASALKFELQAAHGHSAKNERCIRNFVTHHTLVVVTAIVSGSRGDGMMVNMHVSEQPDLCLWLKKKRCWGLEMDARRILY